MPLPRTLFPPRTALNTRRAAAARVSHCAVISAKKQLLSPTWARKYANFFVHPIQNSAVLSRFRFFFLDIFARCGKIRLHDYKSVTNKTIRLQLHATLRSDPSLMLKYKKGFAAVLLLLTALTPISVLAEGLTDAPETAVVIPAEPVSLPQVDTTTPPAVIETTPAEVETTPAESETPPPETETPPPATSLPRVVLNDAAMQLAVAPVYVGQSVFVPVRAFAEAMGCTVTWLPESNSVYITRDDLTMLLSVGSRSIWANRRNWMMDASCSVINDTVMVPVRAMAKVFTCTLNWSAADQTVYLRGGDALIPAEKYYNEEDVLWLARIIYAESGNQPLDGKVAVANVVLNRVENPAFPKTIRDVIFDRTSGVQFTPTSNGTIYRTPTAECFAAARLALEGYETAPDCLYFVSARSATTCWAGRNRTFYAQIGGHAFFR